MTTKTHERMRQELAEILADLGPVDRLRFRLYAGWLYCRCHPWQAVNAVLLLIVLLLALWTTA